MIMCVCVCVWMCECVYDECKYVESHRVQTLGKQSFEEIHFETKNE